MIHKSKSLGGGCVRICVRNAMAMAIGRQRLAIIRHVEPLDFPNVARPGSRRGCESAEFNARWPQIQATPQSDERKPLLADAQRAVARDRVAVCLYPPTWITAVHARRRGVCNDMPLSVNDGSVVSWQ